MMNMKEKKKYVRPCIARVNLTIEEQVLACCKTNAAVNKSGGNKTCSASQCLSSPTNLS